MNRRMVTLDMCIAIPGKLNNGLKALVTLAKAREYAEMHVLNLGRSTV